jgi:hypothetical protein
MRIAELANHQTVERILHFFKREVSLFECVLQLLAPNLADSEDYSRQALLFGQCLEECKKQQPQLCHLWVNSSDTVCFNGLN